MSAAETSPFNDTNEPMTSEQAELLRGLAEDANELDAFKSHVTRAEAARRIAMLRAKIKLMGNPPHVQ